MGSPARGKSDSSNRVPDNALAIVEQVDRKLSFLQFLLKVRKTLLDAYKNQHYPFERLVQDFEMEYVEHKCPLFDVALVLTDIHSGLPAVKNDITITFSKERELVSGRIEFNSSLFQPESIERFSGHFTNVLRNALENTDVLISELQLATEAEQHQLISELQLATEAEQHQLLVEWNNTKTAYPDDKCIHALFEAQVEQTPEAVAVVFANQQLTYQELNVRANQLAHYLQTLGIGPDVLVGLCVERSLEMVIGVLGILKAGGAYLSLDSSYPKDNLAFML